MTINTFLAYPGASPLHDANHPLEYDPSNPDLVATQLRSMRNSIIGSRTKKSSLVNDGSIQQYVRLLAVDLLSSSQAPEIVALSATIIASLANTPAPQTLLQLLRAGAHDALLDSLKRLVRYLKASRQHLLQRFEPDGASTALTDPLKLLEALLRALRSILLAIADQLSASPRWGIGSAWGTTTVSSGIPTSLVNPSAGAIKVVGISSRESRQLPFARFGSDPKDVAMASASSEDLRTKHKLHTKEAEMQQSRELRTLSRSFLDRIYSAENLPYLIGPLFICRIPHQQASSKAGTSSSSGPLRDARMHSRSSSSVGVPSPAPRPSSGSLGDAITSQDPTACVDVEKLPLATRSKILSIIEMVCAIIAGTVFIPGYHATLPAASPSMSETPLANSPEKELAQRRERLLDFTAGNSPYHSHLRDPAAATAAARDDDESRGRNQHEVGLRQSSAVQAELIRKGSRSRSRMKDSLRGSSAETGHLPMWEEEDGFDLVGSEEGPATVLSVLLSSSECGFAKVQEAALWCLAELTRENAGASIRLFWCNTPSGSLPTSMLLNLRQSTSASVRLAAFCCLAHIIKVHPFTPKTNQCVLEVLLELMDQELSGPNAGNGTDTALQTQSHVQIQVQAAFAIARLVADEPELQTLASNGYDALGKLIKLLNKACSHPGPSHIQSDANTPARSASLSIRTLGTAAPAVDEGLIRLREACLSAIAALTFQQDDLRRKAVDTCTPSILSLLVPCLTFPALGVRVAACRLARALSRSISILRTSLVDAGIAPKLIELINDGDEDEAVQSEATAAICNLMTDFSPMRKLVLDMGGVERLVSLARGDVRHPPASERQSDLQTSKSASSVRQELRLNALWALKNMLWKCDLSAKTDVMNKLGWDFVAAQAAEGETVMKEQALNILRNLAVGTSEDVDLVVTGVGGAERLLDLVEKVIWDCKDAGIEGASVIEQVAYFLVNLVTGSDDHRRMIIRRPNLMDALVYFTNHPWKEIRGAACKCVSNLLFRANKPDTDGSQGGDVSLEATGRLRAFGMEERLRALATDAELDVQERARLALGRFEHASEVALLRNGSSGSAAATTVSAGSTS